MRHGAGRTGAAAHHRPGAVERHRALAAGRQPRRRGVVAGEGAIDLGRLDAAGRDEDRFGAGQAALGRRERTPAAAEPGAGAVAPPPAQDADLRRARGGGVFASIETGHVLRVGNDVPVRRDDPQPDVRRLLQPIEQALWAEPAADRRQVGDFGQRGGEQTRLLHHRALLLLEQVLLVGVQVPEAGDRQEHQEGVEQEQADGEAGVSAREARRPRPDATHRSPVRRR